MSADARPALPIACFRDARDVIPARRALAWAELCGLLSPEPPPVRADVARDIDRHLSLVDDALRGLLSGRAADQLQRLGAYRDLEKIAYKARGDGISEAEVRDRLLVRADQLRDDARRQAKTWLPLWSPADYRDGETRGASGVERVSCFVFDHDDGTSIEEALDPWGHSPLLAHTSWSHTDEHPRFRLVLPLAEPVPATAWPLAWAWARERSGGHIDEACKDPSRLYLLPAIPRPEAPFRALVRDDGGPFLSVPWRDLKPPESSRLPRPNAPAARRLDPGRGSGPADAARRVARVMLRTDRATRERAAAWLEAHVSGRRAERILCPSCGRLSVWFWIEPGRQSTAVCNHRNTCGWWGHLDELLDLRGGAHA